MSPSASLRVITLPTSSIFMPGQESDRTMYNDSDSLASPDGSPIPLDYWHTPGSWSPRTQESPPPPITPLSSMSPGSFYSSSPVLARLYQFPEYATQEAVNELSASVDAESIEHDAVLAFDARIPSDQIPLQVSAALGAMTRAVDWVIVALPPMDVLSGHEDAHEAVDTLIYVHQRPPAKLIVMWDDLGRFALDLVHCYGLGGVFAQSAAALASVTAHVRKCQRQLSPSILSQRIRLRRICARSGDVPEAAYHVYASADDAGEAHVPQTAQHVLGRARGRNALVPKYHGKLGLQLLRALHAGTAHRR